MNCCKENKDGDSKEIGENLSKEVTSDLRPGWE